MRGSYDLVVIQDDIYLPHPKKEALLKPIVEPILTANTLVLIEVLCASLILFSISAHTRVIYASISGCDELSLSVCLASFTASTMRSFITPCA